MIADKRPEAERPEPCQKLNPLMREAIVRLCNLPEYRSLPPAFIVADQADQGTYLASESTFYRVLREQNQLHHRGRQQKPRRKSAPTTHQADGSNQIWCWDISWLPGPAKGTWFYLYMIVDLFSRKIVGWEVHHVERADLAEHLVEKAYWREHLAMQDRPLVLHSDNGSPMKAATFLQKLYDLGITPSRSRPRVSNDNAFIESLFKTLKYRPSFPAAGFIDLNASREWVQSFVAWYNYEHRHSALKYVTPEQRHTGEATRILADRKSVYQNAKAQHPERWSGNIQNFDLPKEVHLNPENKGTINGH